MSDLGLNIFRQPVRLEAIQQKKVTACTMANESSHSTPESEAGTVHLLRATFVTPLKRQLNRTVAACCVTRGALDDGLTSVCSHKPGKRDLVGIESEKEDKMLMEDRSGEGEVVTSLCQSS